MSYNMMKPTPCEIIFVLNIDASLVDVIIFSSTSQLIFIESDVQYMLLFIEKLECQYYYRITNAIYEHNKVVRLNIFLLGECNVDADVC